MSQSLLWILSALLCLLAGCAAPSASSNALPTSSTGASLQWVTAPTTRSNPIPSLPPTFTPTPIGTATPTPAPSLTPSPSLTPTSTAAPVSLDRLQVIKPNNAKALSRLARIPGTASLPAPAVESALSPNGQLLALGGGPGVRLWDIRQGMVIRELLPPDDAAYSPGALAFSPDGAQLARIYQGSRIVVWSVETGEVFQVIGQTSAAQALSGLAYAGSAKAPRLVASGMVSGQPGLFFWDALSGDLLAESASGAAEIDPFVVSPNGRMVVQAGRDGVVRFWNGVTGQPSGQQILYACPDSLIGASFNYSGGLLALACDAASDTQARLRLFFYSPNYYRPEAMSLFKVFTSDSPSSGLVTFTVDSSLLAVTSGNAQMGSRANQLELWGFYSHRHEATVSVILRDIRKADFSRDGKLLLLSLSDGSVELWGIPPALP